MAQVAIIGYGVGNLRSVEKAFAATGCEAIVSSYQHVLRAAARLELPGVGAFGACVKAEAARGFDQLVREQVQKGTPLLGVCVGMQLLFETSDEFGSTAGLGLLRGRVKRFNDDLVVPHVGWNRVEQVRNHPLFSHVADQSHFYFVHSYYCEPVDETTIAATTEYGSRYAAIVAHENICGVQFHPEKSQRAGLQLLGNFARLN